jgi:tetratricopeptide (TPR) repeat protein
MADEPLLPPAEPTDNPPAQRRTSRKAVLLWLVLIALFGVCYFHFGDRQDGPAGDSAGTGVAGGTDGTGRPEAPGSIWNAAAWPATSLAVIAVALAFLWWQGRGTAKFNVEGEPGLLALHEGRLDEAISLLEGVAKRYRGKIGYSSVARYNLATALMRKGDLDHARTVLEDVERMPALPYASDARLLAAISLARLHALQGRTDLADRWLEDGRRRLKRAATRLWTAASLRIVEGIVLCRKGDLEAAHSRLDEEAILLEALVSVQGMREVWLLRAFMAAQQAPARDQGEVERWLGMLRPYRQGEFDHLAGAWPELRAFLDGSGIG